MIISAIVSHPSHVLGHMCHLLSYLSPHQVQWAETSYYVRCEIMDWWRNREVDWIARRSWLNRKEKTFWIQSTRIISIEKFAKKNTSSYTGVILRKDDTGYCKKDTREIYQLKKLLLGTKRIDGEFKKKWVRGKSSLSR